MTLADADISSIAELLADPARARIVLTLTDGRPLPAGGLARAAGVTPSGASAHLKKLVNGGLLVVERRGRNRYFQLADPGLVTLVEQMAVLAPQKPAAGPIRLVRMCYDHLAGVIGVGISEALVKEGTFAIGRDGYDVTSGGRARLERLGIDLRAVEAAAHKTRRPLARSCIDWSERRPHLAGALGAALANRLLQEGWLERRPATRALRITNSGRRALRREFDLTVG